MKKQFLTILLMLVPMITLAQSTYKEDIKAAKKGDADAQCRIGLCYSRGDGVEKDEKKAVYWWRKAAEQGHAMAQLKMGRAYEIGEGVTKDPSQALYWYRKSAEQGNDLAQVLLALFHMTDKGGQKDYVQAVYWFRKAAEQGKSEAQYWMGVCCSNGWGVDKNETQGFNWFRKAAEQGHAGAQLCIGYSYAEGTGVSKDYSQAIYWLQKSLDNGEAKAKTYLAVAQKKKQEQEAEDKAQYRSKALRGEIKGVLSYDVDEPFGKNGVFESGDTVCIVGYAESGGYKFYALYSDKNAGTFRPSTRVKKTFDNEDKINFKNLPDIDDSDVKLVIQKQKAVVDSLNAIRLAESARAMAESAKKLIQAYKDNSPFIISDISWDANSAGGIEVSLSITNCTNQAIKYVTFQGYFINPVGDRCQNEIGGGTTWKARGVGPIGPCPTTVDNCSERMYDCKGSYTFDNLTFYSRIANTFKLSSVTVEYTNGRKITLSGANLSKHVRY
ncbi:MAG: sel1 repeat family protein [Prevotella sp.]|nr:sel1 repeat family protein [Prevotella sp.]